MLGVPVSFASKLGLCYGENPALETNYETEKELP